MYTCEHVTKGKDVYIPQQPVYQATKIDYINDFVVYGEPLALDDVDMKTKLVVINPALNAFFVMMPVVTQDGQVFCKRIVMMDSDEASDKIQCAIWEKSNFPGWSGLPIVSTKTWKPVGIYGGSVKTAQFGTLIPVIKPFEKAAEDTKAVFDAWTDKNTTIHSYQAPTGTGKSSVRIIQFAEYLIKNNCPTTNIYVVNPLRQFFTTYQFTKNTLVPQSKNRGDISMNFRSSQYTDLSESRRVDIHYITYGSACHRVLEDRPQYIFCDEVDTQQAHLLAFNSVIRNSPFPTTRIYMSATIGPNKKELLNIPLHDTIMAPSDYLTIKDCKPGNVGLYSNYSMSLNCYQSIVRPRTIIFCKSIAEVDRVLQNIRKGPKSSDVPIVKITSKHVPTASDLERDDCVFVCTDAVASGITIPHLERGVSDGRCMRPTMDPHTGMMLMLEWALTREELIQMMGRVGRIKKSGIWFNIPSHSHPATVGPEFIQASALTFLIAKNLAFNSQDFCPVDREIACDTREVESTVV